MKSVAFSLALSFLAFQLSAQTTGRVPLTTTPAPVTGFTPVPVTGLTPTAPATGIPPVGGFTPAPVSGFAPQAVGGLNSAPVSGYNPAPVGGFAPGAVSGYSQSPITITPTPQVLTPNPVSGLAPSFPIIPPTTNSIGTPSPF